MSKKYVPSGYQIININLFDKTSETPFTPETEDEKLLYEILSSGESLKPILLYINTPNVTLCGFSVIEDGVTIYLSNSNYIESITLSSTKLSWTETKL